MISSSQREHLVYTLTGQLAILVMAIATVFYYVLPGRESIAETQAATSEAINAYKTLQTDGLSIQALQQRVSNETSYEELRKIIAQSPQATIEIIKKDNPQKDYLTWIKEKIIVSDEDKKILIKSKAAINSIMPTMSSIGGSVEEDTITLKGLVSYVEGKLLKQFRIASVSPISIQGVNFSKAKDIPENVGYLDLRLDLLGNSEDIMNLIRYINKSGDPALLTQPDSTNNLNPQVLDNPLFTISQFSLQDLPTNLGPKDENSGRISIRLYLRGGAPKDIRFFQTQLIERIDSLIQVILDAKAKCAAEKNLCNNQDRINENEEKLRIIRKGMNDAIGNRGGLGQIYVLSQFFTTIKNLEEEISLFTSKK